MSALHDQHFLIDPRIMERMLSCIDVSNCRVLEVGPGYGILTQGMLNRDAIVIAVELDPALCEALYAAFSRPIEEKRLILIQGDAVRCPLPPFKKVVSNLPYSISSRITFRMLDIGFSEAILMYQKEFAERMIAPVGTPTCGRLSVMAQTYAHIEPCFTVPPQAFSPMPQVHSMVLRIVPRPPLYPISDRKWYSEVVRALFSQRRKTVRNGLKNLHRFMGAEQFERLIANLPEEILSRRPEELHLKEFATIANAGV